MDDAWVEKKSSNDPDLQRAVADLRANQSWAEATGISQMSMEEIDAEISRIRTTTEDVSHD
jgi:hypothetical protein